MDFSDQTHLKNQGVLIAQLSLTAMVVIGFFVVVFSSPTAMSFIASITGAKVAYAEDPTSDAGGDNNGSDGNDGDGGAACGDSGEDGGDAGCGADGGDG